MVKPKSFRDSHSVDNIGRSVTTGYEKRLVYIPAILILSIINARATSNIPLNPPSKGDFMCGDCLLEVVNSLK